MPAAPRRHVRDANGGLYRTPPHAPTSTAWVPSPHTLSDTQLSSPAEHAPFDDALIAAVAESAGMTVVTRNTRHLEPSASLASIHGTQPWPETDRSFDYWASMGS